MRIALLLSLGVSWSREAALRLSELGHEVHAIDFEYDVTGTYLGGRTDLYSQAIDKLRSKLAGIHIIPGKDISHFRYLLYAPRLRTIYDRIRAEMLFSLWGGGFSLISWASGIRPYAVFLGGDDIMAISGLRKRISRYTLKRAAVTFANGGYLGARAKAFAPQATILPICLGVDPLKFVPRPAPGSPVVVICTRGFAPVYNNRYIIQALALLPDSLPEFRVVFASAGDTLRESREMADNVLSPDVRKRVCFLNGVTDEGMLDNLQNAHIYTSVSRSDGTSISLLEALSCGLFPVLSDIPSNREWIDPKVRNGMLVPLDKPAEYAHQLAEAIRDAERRRAVSTFNRQLVLQRADSRQTMAYVSSVLENALPLRNPSQN